MINPFSLPAIAELYAEKFYLPAVREALGVAARHPLAREGLCVDLGAGTGLVAQGLGQAGFDQLVVVDPAVPMLDRARERLGAGPRYLECVAEELGEHLGGQADSLFAINCLQHFSNMARSLDAISAALKPGGHFIFNLAMPRYRFADVDDGDLVLMEGTLAFLEKLRVLTRTTLLDPAILRLYGYLRGSDTRPLQRDDMEPVFAEFGLELADYQEQRIRLEQAAVQEMLRMTGRIYCENDAIVGRIIERMQLPATVNQRQAFFVARRSRPRNRGGRRNHARR